MTVTEEERQRIITEHEAQKKEELRLHMAELGRRSTARKRRAARKSIKKARAARRRK